MKKKDSEDFSFHPGSQNVFARNEALLSIESLTSQFRKKRISQQEYILGVNKNLSKMIEQRDYIEYLKNIGQY